MDLIDWTPKDYPVRLSGHSLICGGSAWLDPACETEECGDLAEGRVRGQFAGGHARCTCGELSPHLSSGGKRRQWHRDHKRQIASEEG